MPEPDPAAPEGLAGPAVVELVLGDDPEVWADLGFTVDDGAVALGGVRVRLTGDGGGLRSWALAGVGVGTDGAIDGLPSRRLDEVAAPPSRPHPNGITEVDHVVVATPDVERTVAALGAAGLDLRGGRSTESYGAPMRQAFFRPRGAIIEVVGPAVAEGDGPATFFGLALTSPDLDATAAALGAALKPAKAAVQPGRRIATLARGAGVGVPVAVMSPHVRPADLPPAATNEEVAP